MTKKAIVTKFYNEEFLLPFWLKHHREMFDDGILINWHSTDASVDICRELVPNWKVITPTEKQFSTINGDAETTKAEVSLGKGVWKTTLNVTEFLIIPNLDTAINIAESNKMNAIRPARVAVMIDSPDAHLVVDADTPLHIQCHNGLLVPKHIRGKRSAGIKPHVYDGIGVKNEYWSCVHHRIMHNLEHGRYSKGYHRTKITSVTTNNEYYIAWFLYSPYKHVRGRIVQWAGRKPQNDLARNWGTHHFRTPEQIDRRFEDLSWRVEDLLADRRYKDAVIRHNSRYGGSFNA